jgi:hypothetical protein
MPRIIAFSAGCLGFIALVMLIVSVMGGFEGANLGFHGWVAITLGMTVTSALGVALMALCSTATGVGGTRVPGWADPSRAAEAPCRCGPAPRPRSLPAACGSGPPTGYLLSASGH